MIKPVVPKLTEEPDDFEGKWTLGVDLASGPDKTAVTCAYCGSECNERDELTKAEREIERLRAEVEALKLQRTAADIVGRETANIVLLQVGEIEVLRADNKHLRGEFEKAWPDAERYRHLISAEPAWVVSLFENGFSPAEIVDLIDAARSAQEKK